MLVGRLSPGMLLGAYKCVQINRNGSTFTVAQNQNISGVVSCSDVGGMTHMLKPGDKIRCGITNHDTGADFTYTKLYVWSAVTLHAIEMYTLP
jgi:hypothetical protein